MPSTHSVPTQRTRSTTSPSTSTSTPTDAIETGVFKVGFTGPRGGMTAQQQTALLPLLQRLGTRHFHHGDCQGADEQAHHIARSMDGVWIVSHPPVAEGLRAHCEVDEERPAAQFLVRNKRIVLETNILIATPDRPEYSRSGTWSTIRYAHRMGFHYVIINREGAILPGPSTDLDEISA